jgi:hypothetical protein
MGGDGVGQIASRGAGDGLEAELARLRQGDRDDAILERVGRVGGVVLDPQLPEPEALGEPVGPDQGRQPRLEWITGTLGEGEEVGVAPDASRARLDLAAGLAWIEIGEVVRDLQRTEAALADKSSLQRVARFALLADQCLQRHRL